MTVASNISRVSYDGNGVTVNHPTVFPFFDPSDLTVVLRSDAGTITPLQLNVHYDVLGGANEEGIPGPGTVRVNPPPSTTETLVIYRNVPLLQEVDLLNQSQSRAEVIEGAFDRRALVEQQLATRIARAVRAPDADAELPVLPSAVLRAGKLLRFDSKGNPEVIAPEQANAAMWGSIGGDIDEQEDLADKLSGLPTLAGDNDWTGEQDFYDDVELRGEGATRFRAHSHEGTDDENEWQFNFGSTNQEFTIVYVNAARTAVKFEGLSASGSQVKLTLHANGGFTLGDASGGSPGDGGLNAEALKVNGTDVLTAVDAANITATNSPSNGQVPSYDNGDLTWITPSGSGGATNFPGLTDTPSDYTGAADKLVAVNSAGNALEFVNPPSFASVGWGAIFGNLEDQEDLANALGAKLETGDALAAGDLASGTVPGARGADGGDNTDSFLRYNAQVRSAGRLYGGTTTPISSVRVNLDAHFHATKLAEGDTLLENKYLPRKITQIDKAAAFTINGSDASGVMYRYTGSGNVTVTLTGAAAAAGAQYLVLSYHGNAPEITFAASGTTVRSKHGTGNVKLTNPYDMVTLTRLPNANVWIVTGDVSPV